MDEYLKVTKILAPYRLTGKSDTSLFNHLACKQITQKVISMYKDFLNRKKLSELLVSSRL